MEYWEKKGFKSRKEYLKYKKEYYENNRIKWKKYKLNNKKRLSETALRWFYKTAYGGNRKKALERDKYKCVYCGDSNRSLDMHHKDNNGSTKSKNMQNNSLINLITLCDSCHGKLHAGTINI